LLIDSSLGKMAFQSAEIVSQIMYYI